jgi:diacylglycerol kinase (ATP)
MKNETRTAAKERARFSLAARRRSFRHAAAGVVFMFTSQHNAWIHAAFTFVVLCAGWLLKVDASDWRWLVLAIALVWVVETFNTSFEYVCDVISPEHHPSVQLAKDVGAGAVLLGACGAAVLGALTLGPYLLRWLQA